jgi:hypothetical protein
MVALKEGVRVDPEWKWSWPRALESSGQLSAAMNVAASLQLDGWLSRALAGEQEAGSRGWRTLNRIPGLTPLMFRQDLSCHPSSADGWV